jgi:hypothetical protein
MLIHRKIPTLYIFKNLAFFNHIVTMSGMGLFLDDGVLCLEKFDLTDVAFNNLLRGSERYFNFKIGADSYAVFLKSKNIGLDAAISINVKIAGCDAEILLNSLSEIGEINSEFAGIDLEFFDSDTKKMLMPCLFDGALAAFSAASELVIQLGDVHFGDAERGTFSKEIGVNIIKNEAKVVTFNVLLGDDLLNMLVDKFSKLPDAKSGREVVDDFPLEWYLEIGKTNLGAKDLSDLAERDILFLDEDSSIRSGKYTLRGLDEMELSGTLTGSKLVIEGGNF